jgi:RND family efflux transporter MFP subunit
MNRSTEEPEYEEPPESSKPPASGVAKNRRRQRTALVALLALVALTSIAILSWIYFRPSGSAGRPVPAPRSAAEQTATMPSTQEATVTVDPEVLKRSGIRIEPVGEHMAAATGAAIVTTGIVQPNSYRTTPVVSLVGGIVRRVHAELGQTVRQGQPLAVVFSDDLAMAQSRYLTALAELEEHHKHHARTTKLLEIGAASRQDLEQATTKLTAAQTEVASQRQRLLLLGLSSRRVDQLKSPSQVSSEIIMTAPVSGVVIARTANPGEVITADRELLRVADLSTVWVIGQVYERDLARVVVGSGANISVETYPGRVFRGRVSYIDPTLDPATRTAQARIELANPGQPLKIGMYVNVAFAGLGGAESTVAVVPKDAVQNMNNQQVVFVETNVPNIFALRPIKLGPESDGHYQVIEGLNAGDRIVTEGSFLLRAEWMKTNASHIH